MADAFTPGSSAALVRAQRLELALALVEQILQDAKGPPGPRGVPGSPGLGPLTPLPVVTGLLSSATTVADLKATLQSLMSALAGKYHMVVDSTT